jgi:hypothetical protein
MLIGWWKWPTLNCGNRSLRILVRKESARHPTGAETVQHLQARKALVSARIQQQPQAAKQPEVVLDPLLDAVGDTAPRRQVCGARRSSTFAVVRTVLEPRSPLTIFIAPA